MGRTTARLKGEESERRRPVRSSNADNVPFFRPDIGEAESQEVLNTIRSGWLTTGPKVRRFEEEFGKAVGGRHALALNSCTAALHLAAEALGLRAGQGVLVPTMTFAATAEVVRYLNAYPVLVDCDPVTGNMDLADAARKLERARRGDLPGLSGEPLEVVGLMPVHVGGLMMNLEAVTAFARANNLWLVEDAAHAFPAAWRASSTSPWQKCGEGTADVTCFSFYANKTITTGEGGMAVTNREDLFSRMKLMALHGLSRDAWDRYSGGGSWDYRIVAPGYKYNMTDVAAAIGIHQLARAGAMRQDREAAALELREALSSVDEVEIPPVDPDRVHSWHLFPIRLHLERLSIDRNTFIEMLKSRGIGCSVHWRPLHLHTYYEETYGWKEEDLPNASALWPRLISLPLFSKMTSSEKEAVVAAVKSICAENRK